MQGSGKAYLSVNNNDKWKQFWSIKYERNNTSFLRHINFDSFNNFRESVLLSFFLEKQADRLRDVTSLAQSYTVLCRCDIPTEFRSVCLWGFDSLCPPSTLDKTGLTSLLRSPFTVCWGTASPFRNILYILPVLGVKGTPPHLSSILPSTIAQLLLSSVLISFLFNAGTDWQLGGVLRWWIPAGAPCPLEKLIHRLSPYYQEGWGRNYPIFGCHQCFLFWRLFE